MEEELEGLELDYLRRQALNTITPKSHAQTSTHPSRNISRQKRGGSRPDRTRQLESEFGIDALFHGEKQRSSPRKGRPPARRGRPTPELSREVIDSFSSRARRSPGYNHHPKLSRGSYERYPPSNYVHESYPVASRGKAKTSLRKKHKPRKRRSSSRSSYSSSSGSRSSYSSSRSSSRSRSHSSSSSSRSSYSRSRSSSSSSYSKSSYSSSPSRSASPASHSKKKQKQSRHHTHSHPYEGDSHRKQPSKKLSRPRLLSASPPPKRPRLSLESPPNRVWYPDPPMYDRSPYDSHGGHLRTLPPDLRKGRLPSARHEAEWSSKSSRHHPLPDEYDVDSSFSPSGRHLSDYAHDRLRGPPQHPPSREARVVRHVSARYPPDKSFTRDFYDKAPPPRRPLSSLLAPRSHRGDIRHGRMQREAYSPDRNRHSSERFQLSRPRWEEGGRRVYGRHSSEGRYDPGETHSVVGRTHLPTQGFGKVAHRSRRERSESVDDSKVTRRYKQERRERSDYDKLENIHKTEKWSDTIVTRDSNSKSVPRSREKEASKTDAYKQKSGKEATVNKTAKVGKGAPVKETPKEVERHNAGKEAAGKEAEKRKEVAVKDTVKQKVALKEEVAEKEVENVVKETVSEPPAQHEEMANSPPEVDLLLQESSAEVENVSDILGASGSGLGEEELDYDESMEGLDLFPIGSIDVGTGEMGREDNQQDDKRVRRNRDHESGSDSGSESGTLHKKYSNTESELSSEDNGEGSRIMSPIRVTPERKGSRMVRKTSLHQSGDKLPVKERLYVSKRDIERKKRLIGSDGSEPPSKLRPSLANRLGPSPFTRRHDWPRHRSEIGRAGGRSSRTHKGNAFAIAEAFRRKKRQEEVLRKEEIQKAKKLTKMLNEPDPKAISKKVEQYDNDGGVVEKERALDRRIGELKEQNKAIIKRNKEIEMDKEIYG